MLDGKTSQSKIDSATGVAQTTISDWLAIFVKEGLASPPDEYYPSHRALFTLQELGIDLAALKKRTKKSSKTSSKATQTTPEEKPSIAQPGALEKYMEAEKNGTSKQ